MNFWWLLWPIRCNKGIEGGLDISFSFWILKNRSVGTPWTNLKPSCLNGILTLRLSLKQVQAGWSKSSSLYRWLLLNAHVECNNYLVKRALTLCDCNLRASWKRVNGEAGHPFPDCNTWGLPSLIVTWGLLQREWMVRLAIPFPTWGLRCYCVVYI